ncbi:PUA-like domain-containing protein [Fusarium flagelliforme]|uniref:PUA-like domain-containing protein n=1 Tax=Fusarium flagelliforme TaxID=2675880 RepID=UPI001E8EE02B|nr:PUA-like domain-containing protein [Fusarium flagelliforme]KAH7188442.1 PUA-like domain-containing protein [Fusarium flagelliforme]
MPIMDARPPKTPVTNRKSYSQAPLSARLDPERRRWSSINDQADYMSSSKGKGKAPATNPEQDSQPQSLSQLQPGPITYRKGRKSFAPRIGYDADWLREMCDSIRSNLHDGRPEPRWEELMGFLKAVLRDENDGSRAIEFETIRNTHLDKLISEIINPRYRHPRVPTRFTTDIQLAERLERKWIERFRGPYFHIEQHRYRELSRHGRLRDVTLNLDAENPEDRWQANDGETLSEMEGNLEIEPGHWWLNLACAHRDGIVGSNREKPTKGKYGVAALPLLTGQENIDYDDGAIRYVRQGRIRDIHVSLISQVGATFRILRGYRLRSPFAPKAGIRYDGLYTIRRYSQWFNEVSERHHMMLTLERVSDQQPIEDVLNIPRPSELDDWDLYQKYESELIKQKRGDKASLD